MTPRAKLASEAEMNELLGRTLVLVAHPDDEAVAFGALLQRMCEPLVVFATDAAPRDEFYWRGYGSREAYARVRHDEAIKALALAGVRNIEFLSKPGADEPIVDQELFCNLPWAFDAVSQIVDRTRPAALLTLAYEGGHPDHDACNFLAAMIADEFGIPAWEAPLYYRAHGEFVTQSFLVRQGSEIEIELTFEERRIKQQMFAAYKSQAPTLSNFDPGRELVRPIARYDYLHPPHPGQLNYEAWQWPMRGSDLCEQFMRFRTGVAR